MRRQIPVSFAASAVTDMEAILACYTEEGTPETGKKIVAEVVRQVERLGSYPLSGQIVPEFDLKDLREVIHPPFRIVYRCDRKKIRVVRVWRSERLKEISE